MGLVPSLPLKVSNDLAKPCLEISQICMKSYFFSLRKTRKRNENIVFYGDDVSDLSSSNETDEDSGGNNENENEESKSDEHSDNFDGEYGTTKHRRIVFETIIVRRYRMAYATKIFVEGHSLTSAICKRTTSLTNSWKPL